MSITLHEPKPSGAPAWLKLGARAHDTAEHRVGVAQLFRDDLGNVDTNRPIQRTTHVLLRPLDTGQPWWAHVADLEHAREEGR